MVQIDSTIIALKRMKNKGSEGKERIKANAKRKGLKVRFFNGGKRERR